MCENTTPGPELPRDFCAGIGPLQLGVVLVLDYLYLRPTLFINSPYMLWYLAVHGVLTIEYSYHNTPYDHGLANPFSQKTGPCIAKPRFSRHF